MGGDGTMEFLELGFDDFEDCRDFKVIVGSMVGDIPGSVRRTLDAFDVGWLS